MPSAKSNKVVSVDVLMLFALTCMQVFEVDIFLTAMKTKSLSNLSEIYNLGHSVISGGRATNYV